MAKHTIGFLWLNLATSVIAADSSFIEIKEEPSTLSLPQPQEPVTWQNIKLENMDIDTPTKKRSRDSIDDSDKEMQAPQSKRRAHSTFEVDPTKWHWDADKLPSSGVVELAVKIQQYWIDQKFIVDGKLQKSAAEIRELSLAHFGAKNFNNAYQAACKYADKLPYEVIQKCAVHSHSSHSAHSTFEVDPTKWHGDAKLPSSALAELAVKIQQYWIDQKFIVDGKLQKSAAEIRELSLAHFGAKNFKNAYQAAYKYADKLPYEVIQQCAVHSHSSHSAHSTFEVDPTKWHEDADKLPSSGVAELAVKIQQYWIDQKFIVDGKLQKSATEIRKLSLAHFGAKNFDNAYPAACKYADKLPYEVIQQCMTRGKYKKKAIKQKPTAHDGLPPHLAGPIIDADEMTDSDED